MKTGKIISLYKAGIRQKISLLFVMGAVMAAVAVYALSSGEYPVSLNDLALVLTGKSGGASRAVILNIRLPRIVSAIICGWGLSIAGLCIQSLLKNPLGSPSTLGISHGAAFGAALCIVLFGSHLSLVTAFAFAGAMGTTIIILIIARLKNLAPEAVILAGVALSSLFASATILIQYLASETELAMVVFWTFGDVARSNWREIGIMAAAVLLISGFLMRFSWDFNALASGAETATGLGVNVDKIRIWGMVAATLIAAIATAFHGVIAFVGLIAPHMARRMAGDNHSLLIPYSSVIGAFLLLGADTLGRGLIGSGTMPVGVITSFLGAPMFLYLLVRGHS